MLPLKLGAPLYLAVIECDPDARDAVAKVAVPLVDSGLVPSDVVPSMNVTLPVGVPVPGGFTVTVAMKVTVWPEQLGFGEEVIVVVVPTIP